jgi:hypothetical protein
VNARPGRAGEPAGAVHAIDADGLALSTGNGQAANLVLLGFALARLGARDAGGLLFCSAEDLQEALAERMGRQGSRLQTSLDALSLGMRHGKG